ncbi:MAG: hypothetical protein IPK16_14860 [Anaerolineales bacterium]|nr:hypothetical protein [Anaerolineales bacterium]
MQAKLVELDAAVKEASDTLAAAEAELAALGPAAGPGCDSDFSEWSALAGLSTGTLNARTRPVQDPQNACLLPPSAGYRRLENQLYRVEVHRPGALGTATFKWSRENGSVVSRITRITGSTIEVADLGRDTVLGFRPGDWVEILDDALELQGWRANWDRLTRSMRRIWPSRYATPRPSPSPPNPTVSTQRGILASGAGWKWTNKPSPAPRMGS